MPDHDRDAEARDALERTRRESDTFGGSALARAGQRLGDHFAGRDADVGDWADVWGRRIGRALSLIGVIVLAYLLGLQLKLW
jgi:hypothetical protein